LDQGVKQFGIKKIKMVDLVIEGICFLSNEPKLNIPSSIDKLQWNPGFRAQKKSTTGVINKLLEDASNSHKAINKILKL
jgi:hypothetical protein